MFSQFVDLARRKVRYNKVVAVADRGLLEDLWLEISTVLIETIINNEIFCEA